MEFLLNFFFICLCRNLFTTACQLWWQEENTDPFFGALEALSPNKVLLFFTQCILPTSRESRKRRPELCTIKTETALPFLYSVDGGMDSVERTEMFGLVGKFCTTVSVLRPESGKISSSIKSS